MSVKKYVYFFGNSKVEGKASDKMLLGGKGANLAEMTNIGISVPPGFTISTEACKYYYANQKSYPDTLKEEILTNIRNLEKETGKKFGDKNNPLLISIRSGSVFSMPGMMDTILNLGLCDSTIEGLIQQTGSKRSSYDSYRRFIQMFGNVVLGIAHYNFEMILDSTKKKKKVLYDNELDAESLKKIIKDFQALVQDNTGLPFPQDPKEQLWKAIDTVFSSWMNERAITYRKLNDISENLGTAVNVQSMVFGNMGESSGTGVVFTRNPATGKKEFYGEFLQNAQGEDVVAGIRTPQSIAKLERIMPQIYKKLVQTSSLLEKHYTDMQDIEFTIEKEKLYILQTRNAKRTTLAEIRIAVEMVQEGLINKREAVKRINPNNLPSVLAKIFDKQEKEEAIKKQLLIGKGLAAGPGAATGIITFSAEKTVEFARQKKPSILVRIETSPEDISGMHSAEGILTARGGMTSHAAVVARGMNKPCIVGCTQLEINYEYSEAKFLQKEGFVSLKEGDWISIDGFTGEIINSRIRNVPSEIEQVLINKSLSLKSSFISQNYVKLMSWADSFAKLKVRANADTAEDASVARAYGAEGIGLCRTEHMFFGKKRILFMQEMIIASSKEERQKALNKLLKFQKEDFKKIFREMSSLPVTIRLLDPPLHEFLPHTDEAISQLSRDLNKKESLVKARIDELKEFNPMLGHRGCRLGITYPEITEMQIKAIIEAACEVTKEKIEVFPEIMVPLVGNHKEFTHQEKIIRKLAEEIIKDQGVQLDYLLGTMIEVPRAAITAEEIARAADFFSFGTNDLTQMGSGFSRDDAENFLKNYIEFGIYEKNPFQVLDREGIGKLIQIAIKQGQSIKPDIKLGVCGEHGGDPNSIEFCHKVGLDYVSCSPYRVPVARLAAAQAALLE